MSPTVDCPPRHFTPAKFKPNTPYGSMPSSTDYAVLKVDGKMLTGSGSMQRYLAEMYGLAGSNAWENAEIDSIANTMNDITVICQRCNCSNYSLQPAPAWDTILWRGSLCSGLRWPGGQSTTGDNLLRNSTCLSIERERRAL